MTVLAPVVAGTPTTAEQNSAGTSLTLTKPSGVQTGDILVAVLRGNSQTTTTTWALTGWNPVGHSWTPSDPATRVTAALLHYVGSAGSEPSSYTFTVGSGNTRLSGEMFIVRPDPGAVGWGGMPTIAQATTFSGSGPCTIGTFSCTANSLVFYVGGNEIVSGNTTTWTPPSGSTDIGLHGSLNPDATTSTRSVIGAACEVITGTSVSGKQIAFPSYAGTDVIGFAIPGTNAVPTTTKTRFGRAELTGTAPTTSKARWGRAELTGTAAVGIAPLPAQTVEPETTVTLTAALAAGGSADSWSWRRISGPAITFIGTGASVQFNAPSGMPPAGATVVVGVTAVVGGVTSPEQAVTITVLPQIRWALSGGAWVGRKPIVGL